MESAGVVVYTKVDKTVKYLLLHNSKGHWDFPKGRIEEGEERLTAALRELKEEAGIMANIDAGFEASLSYYFTDEDGEKAFKTVHFFLGETKSTNVTLSFEHNDFSWLTAASALELLPFEESQKLIKKVEQYLADA
jgi:bis(5'-nucleosidyl)-tetraphosphatase